MLRRNAALEGYGGVSPVETGVWSTTGDDCRAVAAGFVDADIKQLQDAGAQ